MMTAAEEPEDAAFNALRRYAPMVYGPTALYSLGQGAVLPVLPTIAAGLGADLATSALVVATIVIGQLCGNIPAGWLVSRFSERTTMVCASIASLLGIAGTILASHVPVLMLAAFVIGLCSSSFAVARQTFMTTRVPFRFRARALSLVGGSFRLGGFTGPFVAAGLIAMFGTERASLWFFGICMALVALLVAVGPDPERKALEAERLVRRGPVDATDVVDTGEPVTGPIGAVETGRRGVWATIWEYRRLLFRLGTASAAMAGVRASRQAILPLWGLSIGLDPSTIAIVVGIAGAVEFSLFYASGQVMDRFGRLWAAVPSLVMMAFGFGVLGFTHDLTGSSIWFIACALLIGLGNGMSSGILLTLAADVAPKDDPAPFLGAWRTLTDGGGAVMPLLISALTAAFSLSVATGAVGIVALLGAVGFVRWVPRFTDS